MKTKKIQNFLYFLVKNSDQIFGKISLLPNSRLPNYYSTYIGSFKTNYIILRNADIFTNFFWKPTKFSKRIKKEKRANIFGIFHCISIFNMQSSK